MHLKTLTLRGFKSFASATTMVFEPGVNVIVGPNGSGKSNVVDALSWVMGEQGVKQLRGGNMVDVIFAGTQHKAALGRAEVSLTIDNSDGQLPIDYSEVTISRTIFRSGGSEYAINGSSCRLLDIQELLSDTGMGKEMHVIIGQGKLDEVLTATPEERRSFIEEAAGVLKHRKRKEKALRKLDNMQESVTRLEDLSKELRRQLAPLARQADAARKAQVIQAQVRDAKARLLADDLAQQASLLETEDFNDAQMKNRLDEVKENLAKANEDFRVAEEEEISLRPELGKITSGYERLVALEERFRSLGELAKQKLESLRSQTFHVDENEPDMLLQRAHSAREEEEKLRTQIHERDDALSSYEVQRHSHEDLLRDSEKELQMLRKQVSQQRDEAHKMQSKISTTRARIAALESEKKTVHENVERTRERLREEQQQYEELEADVKEIDPEGDNATALAYEKLSVELSSLVLELEEEKKRAQSLREEIASENARAQTLKSSLEVEDASAWVLDKVHDARLIYDLLSIERGWEEAIQAVVEHIVSGLYIPSVDGALDILQQIKNEQVGKVSLVFASGNNNSVDMGKQRDYVKEICTSIGKEKLYGSEIVLARDIVKEDVCLSDVFDDVLSRIVCVKEMRDASAFVQKMGDAFSFVATGEGDVLTTYHMCGGVRDASAFLVRKSAYEDAVKIVEEKDKEYACVRADIEEKEEEKKDKEEAQKKMRKELNEHNERIASLKAQLSVLGAHVENFENDIHVFQDKHQRIDDDIQRYQEELAEHERVWQLYENDPQDMQEKIDTYEEKIKEIRADIASIREKEVEERLQKRSLEERMHTAAGKAEGLERAAKRARENERRQVSIVNVEDVYKNTSRALTTTSLMREDYSSKRTSLQEKAEEYGVHIRSLRSRVDDLRAQEKELEDAHHRKELALAQHKMRYEQLEERAVEELGMDASTLIDEYGPHVMIEDDKGELVAYVRSVQEELLVKNEKRLARLGKINPLALEEHAALEERSQYLTEQLQDLRKSRSDLLTLIRDIDNQVEEVLSKAFVDVAEKFKEVFSMLFPGGEGKLVFLGEDDPLSAGIDIYARPPGKKVKRLSLLSGGERSLTALAFLIAIFMARPSPFYVMDEVEAALDDVNLSRLLALFEKLQTNSQLLIITHHKRTMEIADIIYGITMKEQGVTHVLSQRLADIQTV